MRTYWFRAPRPGNLGDMLTPWILRHEGIEPEWVHRTQAQKTLMVGSIIQQTQRGDQVWGSGMLWDTAEPNPKSIYHAVRGPLTRRAVLKAGGKCPNIIGDPGLLMPRLFPVENIGGDGECIVPHHVDYKQAKEQYPHLPSINVLNSDPTKVISEICKYDVVYASSLHGLILAHAYGIPAVWVRLSDKLAGNDVKFKDYYQSVALTVPNLSVIDAKAKDKAMEDFCFICPPDLDALWGARPWKK